MTHSRRRNDIWMLYVSPNKSFSVDSGALSYFRNRFDASPMSKSWAPPQVKFTNSKLSPKDFVSWMPGAPVVSARAKEVLGNLEGLEAEFLPLFDLRGKSYFAMNVMHETTHLDKLVSKIEYFDENESEIMMVRSACFDFADGPIPPAFKIRGYAGDIYVSHVFASTVREAGLTGVLFLDPRTDVLSRLLRADLQDDFTP